MGESGRIGKYAVVETLGSGGMATVYRAIDPDLQRHVAVKVLHPHLCGRDESRVRFRREARAVARLRHTNVLEVYEAGEEDGRPYMVTEIVDGGSLEAWARARAPIPPEVAAAIGLRIAEGLHAAHEAGIIHRDLKPGNILMGAGSTIKVADFGIAQVLDVEHVTSTGQVLGSPAFMSPEHLEGGRLDARADVFSFGTLLYWLLLGELPFTGPNAHAVLSRVIQGDFPDPARVRPDIGEHLAKVIRTCMQRSRDDRYASMADVASALRAFLAMAGSPRVDSLLSSFEADPDSARRAIRERRDAAILERCRLLRGTKGSGPEIRGLCGWILACDPAHPEASRLVEETLPARPLRRRALAVGAALAVVAAAAALLLVSSRDSARPPDPPVAVDVAVAAGREAASAGVRAADAGSAAEASGRTEAGRPTDADAETPEEAAVTPAAGDAAQDPDVGDAGADSAPVHAGEVAIARSPPDAFARPPPAARERRIVVFRPLPQNVEILVDGRSIGRYGPEGLGFVTQTEVETGAREFSFVPLSDCCYAATWAETVPAGDGPHTVGRKLQWRPARITVDTGGEPATVDVLGRATGRANQEISIPFDAHDPFELRLRISVTFPGSRPIVLPERVVRAGETIVIRDVRPPEGPG